MIQKELKELIKLRELNGVYYLYGEEKFFVTKYKDLCLSAFDGEFRDFNVQFFDQENFTLQKVFDAFVSLPFMAQKKCVCIENFNVDTIDQSTLKSFRELLKKIPDSTVVIIVESLLVDDSKVSSKQKTFVKFINSVGNAVEFPKLSRTQLAAFLELEASKSNVSLSRVMAYDIIDKCGNDINMLKNEISKLCAYVGDRSVTKEDLQEILVFSTQTNVFELIKALMLKNEGLAHKRLDMLFQKREEPIAILAIISSTYVDLYRVKVMLSAGLVPSNLEKYFNYKGKGFKIDIASKNCGSFSLDDIRYYLSEIIKADIKLKSSRVSSRIILDKLVCNLCR